MGIFCEWFNPKEKDDEVLVSKHVEKDPAQEENYFEKVTGDEAGVVTHNEVEDAKNSM